jgi:amidase
VTAPASRRLLAVLLVVAGLLCCSVSAQAKGRAPRAHAPVLNLETLSGQQEEQMLKTGRITSVELVRAYLARIAALNKSGPALDAVTQINPDALKEAAEVDRERAEGINLGPAMGLPILLKDIIDASPMYTSAGDWALRQSYAPDSGVAKELKAHGVIILGKTGLSEWANSFGSQPSGFSNLTGQVLSAIDTAEGPSGSSSGSAAAASSALASLTIGTETSGSIISPSTEQADVGLRPTVGLVPGYGIAPIDASQDTAGPIVRDVADAAMTLQSISEDPGSDPTANKEYLGVMGPNYLGDPATGQLDGVDDIPAAPPSWGGTLPNYLKALTTSFVKGKSIGYNGTCPGFVPGNPNSCTSTPTTQQAAYDTAVDALDAGGANMVPDNPVTNAPLSALPSDCEPGATVTSCNWEAHATIDEYYLGIDPKRITPTSLQAEVAYDNTDPQEAEKDGNSAHLSESESDDSTITDPSDPTQLGVYNADWYSELLPIRKASYHTAIDAEMNCPNNSTTNTTATTTIPLPSGPTLPSGGGPMTVDDGTTTCNSGPNTPVIAIIGSTGTSSPAAGYPEMVVPAGYTPTQRRNIGVDISGGAYDEYNILGVGYVIEQATKAREGVGEVDPAAYRCAHTDPAEPFASRGDCNADDDSIMSILGDHKTFLSPSLGNLETLSASQAEADMDKGRLTSLELVKAELTRIALSNANGPAIQAVRTINPEAISEAIASDSQRARFHTHGPLQGIPVLVDDTTNVHGMETTGGSIALQGNFPASDATLVAKLKAAGAVILGTTNTTELDGIFDDSDIDTPLSTSCTANQGGLSVSTGCNMPQGYSSLGGQVLLPSDTNKSLGGSSAGSAAAVAAGYAPLAIGMETGTDAAEMIAPAGNAGAVALKPTVGLISRYGLMPDSPSQDSPGPIGQTVTDVADALQVMAGRDGHDPASETQPSKVPNYTAGLSSSALNGAKISVLSTSTAPGSTAPYPTVVSELSTLGATPVTVTPGAATTAPSVVPYEFHQAFDKYLASTRGHEPKSLASLIAYYNADPVEGLKYSDDGLANAASVNYDDPTTTAAYQSDLAQGQSEDRAVLSALLGGVGATAIVVPQNSYLVGVADRAGYPVLTVPAGYGSENSSTGGDPIGVDLIGAPYTEATLLDYGYAYEQGTLVRKTGPSYMVTTSNTSTFSGAPSETNQSMWRCVPGSAFFSPYECNAGDLENPFPLNVFPPSPLPEWTRHRN